MQITDLPGWAAAEVVQLLNSPLNDEAVLLAVRSVLKLVETQLLQHGTTAALLAKELVARRRSV